VFTHFQSIAARETALALNFHTQIVNLTCKKDKIE
jgi:hypothetical protein